MHKDEDECVITLRRRSINENGAVTAEKLSSFPAKLWKPFVLVNPVISSKQLQRFVLSSKPGSWVSDLCAAFADPPPFC